MDNQNTLLNKEQTQEFFEKHDQESDVLSEDNIQNITGGGWEALSGSCCKSCGRQLVVRFGRNYCKHCKKYFDSYA